MADGDLGAPGDRHRALGARLLERADTWRPAGALLAETMGIAAAVSIAPARPHGCAHLAEGCAVLVANTGRGARPIRARSRLRHRRMRISFPCNNIGIRHPPPFRTIPRAATPGLIETNPDGTLPAMQGSRASSAPRASPWWTAALILGLALACYLPALRGAPVWDDDAHVTGPELRSLHGLWRIWFEPGATQQYYPLLHSAFWVEHRLWGDSASATTWLNVLLHSAAAAARLVLRRLGVPGAALAALVFALHPVCVESVAWISEQKNTLSPVFYLLPRWPTCASTGARGPPAYLAGARPLRPGAPDEDRDRDAARGAPCRPLVAAGPA